MSANNIVPGAIRFKRGTVNPITLSEGELFIKQIGTNRQLLTKSGENIIPFATRVLGTFIFSWDGITMDIEQNNTGLEINFVIHADNPTTYDIAIFTPENTVASVYSKLSPLVILDKYVDLTFSEIRLENVQKTGVTKVLFTLLYK